MFDKKTLRTIYITALVMCLIFLLLILTVAGGALYLRNGPGLVIIDSKVTDIPQHRGPPPFDDILLVPLMETLDYLNFEITTEDGNIYTIQKDGTQYTLNYQQEALIKNGDITSIYYIDDIPRTFDYYRYKENNDIYLSVDAFRMVMEKLECDYEISGYGDWRIVEITSRGK